MEEKLVRATLELMMARSLKFTMDDLAKKLHVSKSTIYDIVDSKEDLIRLVMHKAIDKFNREKEPILHGEGPVTTRLMQLCGLYFHTVWYLPDVVMEDLQYRYDEISAEWEAFKEAGFDDMVSLLQEGVDKGEYRKVNVMAVRQIIFCAAKGLTDPEFLRKSGMTSRALMDVLEDVMLKGLEKRSE